MSLIIDKQTLDDLNIFGKRNKDSVYAIFNRTHTRGGAEVLEQLFRYPLSDAAAINHRSSIIRHFTKRKIIFPFKGDLFDAAEQYLADTDERNRLSYDENSLRRKFDHLIGADSEHQQIFKGITAIIGILVTLTTFLQDVTTSEGTPYDEDIREISELMNLPVTNKALS